MNTIIKIFGFGEEKNEGETDFGFTLKINPFTMYFYRAGLGLLGGMMAALVILIVLSVLLLFSDLQNTIPFLVWPILVGLGFVIVAGPEDTLIEVPGTLYYALLTWLGIPLPILLKTGKYSWIGKRLGFGISDTVLGKDSGGFTDEEGFIVAGQLPFSVWNSGRSQEENRAIISAPAKNYARIRASLTLVLQLMNPRKTLDSDDPALDIGERARQEFRELIQKFVDTDIPGLADITDDLLTGSKLITSFLPHSVKGHKAGAMIRDNGGNAMFEILLPDEDEDVKRKEFLARIFRDADEVLLKSVVKKNDDGEIEVNTHEVEVKNPIQDLLRELGIKLVRLTFGEIILSEPVSEAAEEASSEAGQREAQLASAKTMREAREIMLPSKEELANPGWENAMILAAAQDDKTGSVKVVLVPGGNKLAAAGVAAAGEIGGSK